MGPDLLKALQDEAKERDAYQLSLGDILDVKASIALVIITFLADVARGVLVDEHARAFLKILQIFGVFALIGAGVLAILVLMPTDYKLPAPVDEIARWTRTLTGNDSIIYEKFVKGMVQTAHKRTLANYCINLRKSDYLNAAFRLTFLALIVELITLIWLPFQH
jgi:hypothetical protein